MNRISRRLFTTLSASAFALCISGASSSAQWIVEDPGAIAQDAANQVVNLGKYVEMINNQVEQINTLTQQLEQITAYTKAFGDPSQILNVVGADALANSLNQTGLNRTLGEIRELSDGVSSLRYNAEGLYNEIGDTTFSGVAVPRLDDIYRKFGAVNQATQNYTEVYDDVFARRKAIKGQMVSTGNRLQSATTNAETQKLTGVMVGQAADLEAIDRELDFATSQALVQDIENRNDQERQAQAAAEEMAADRHDAMTKMGNMLIPDTSGRFNAEP